MSKIVVTGGSAGSLDALKAIRHALPEDFPAPVLVAPPDLHLTVAMSGERACGANAIGVLLSGFLDDGTVGLQATKACGGVALVQDPDEAEAPEMPASALEHASVEEAM
jgi:two-component system chemotaxis response regulator CheB